MDGSRVRTSETSDWHPCSKLVPLHNLPPETQSQFQRTPEALMRLRDVLFVATTLLILSTYAVAEAELNPSSNELLGGNKLFLRSGRATGTNNDLVEGDEEERAVDVAKVIDVGKVQKVVALEKNAQEVAGLKKTISLANHFQLRDLYKMVDDEAFKAQKFGEWYEARLTAGEIREKLHLRRYKFFDELLLDYINKYNPSKERITVIDRNERVHFGEDTVHMLPEAPQIPSWKAKLSSFLEKLRCRDGCIS